MSFSLKIQSNVTSIYSVYIGRSWFIKDWTRCFLFIIKVCISIATSLEGMVYVDNR